MRGKLVGILLLVTIVSLFGLDEEVTVRADTADGLSTRILVRDADGSAFVITASANADAPAAAAGSAFTVTRDPVELTFAAGPVSRGGLVAEVLSGAAGSVWSGVWDDPTAVSLDTAMNPATSRALWANAAFPNVMFTGLALRIGVDRVPLYAIHVAAHGSGARGRVDNGAAAVVWHAPPGEVDDPADMGWFGVQPASGRATGAALTHHLSGEIRSAEWSASGAIHTIAPDHRQPGCLLRGRLTLADAVSLLLVLQSVQFAPPQSIPGNKRLRLEGGLRVGPPFLTAVVHAELLGSDDGEFFPQPTFALPAITFREAAVEASAAWNPDIMPVRPGLRMTATASWEDFTAESVPSIDARLEASIRWSSLVIRAALGAAPLLAAATDPLWFVRGGLRWEHSSVRTPGLVFSFGVDFDLEIGDDRPEGGAFFQIRYGRAATGSESDGQP